MQHLRPRIPYFIVYMRVQLAYNLLQCDSSLVRLQALLYEPGSQLVSTGAIATLSGMQSNLLSQTICHMQAQLQD